MPRQWPASRHTTAMAVTSLQTMLSASERASTTASVPAPDDHDHPEQYGATDWPASVRGISMQQPFPVAVNAEVNEMNRTVTRVTDIPKFIPSHTSERAVSPETTAAETTEERQHMTFRSDNEGIRAAPSPERIVTKRDRTHWLYLAVIAAVVGGVDRRADGNRGSARTSPSWAPCSWT